MMRYWWSYTSDNLGDLIFQIAYKGDRYDNVLLPNPNNKTSLSFIRGDIRCERLTRILIILLIIITF